MSSPKNYTAHDIERYHRGDMSAAEMHALEKAALDDPMLADALDGYLLTPTPAADLEVLQERLQQRLEQKKEQRKVFFFSPQWMKIAALFILIAVAGWLVFQTFVDKGHDIASFEADETKRLERSTSADSIVTAQTAPPAVFSDSLQQGEEVVASNRSRKSGASVSTTPTSAAPQTMMSDVAKEKQTETTPANEAAASDVALLNSPALANTSRAAPDTGRHAEMAQQRAGEPGEATAKIRMQSPRAKAAVPEAAGPEGGWPAFEKYLADNRKPAETIRQNKVATQEVTLAFDIDKNGRPANIVVTKSLCEKCSEEAIRLLKEGPKWKGEKATVNIAIPR